MGYNALASKDSVERLYPEGHPLHRLVRPTFDTLRRALGGAYISAIWVDSSQDPSRAGFRVSYDELYGPGSVNVMPFIASWLSTGAGSGPEGNVVLLPEAIDRTVVDHMKRVGLLGEVDFVRNIADLKRKVAASGRKVYSIDDLGDDFDAHSVVTGELSRWLNSKGDLPSVTAYAPQETVKDMYDATLDDYERARRGDGRVFLKTCNTEAGGAGVFIASSAEEFDGHLRQLREKQQKWNLSRKLVIQPEIKGRNRSFQVFLDPRRPDEVQVVAVTDQLVEADGKTYSASINHPITPETLDHVGPAMLDMVDRVWARHPEAFGFLMSDYFQTDDGVVIYDPGIRPTGNTATALACHFARKLTGRDMQVGMIHLRTGRNGLKFEAFARVAGALAEPENLIREGLAVLPWGWNDVVGFGVLIAIAPDREGLDALRQRVQGLSFA